MSDLVEDQLPCLGLMLMIYIMDNIILEIKARFLVGGMNDDMPRCKFEENNISPERLDRPKKPSKIRGLKSRIAMNFELDKKI